MHVAIIQFQVVKRMKERMESERIVFGRDGYIHIYPSTPFIN